MGAVVPAALTVASQLWAGATAAAGSAANGIGSFITGGSQSLATASQAAGGGPGAALSGGVASSAGAGATGASEAAALTPGTAASAGATAGAKTAGAGLLEKAATVASLASSGAALAQTLSGPPKIKPPGGFPTTPSFSPGRGGGDLAQLPPSSFMGGTFNNLGGSARTAGKTLLGG